jgi:hypothetical protein
MRVEVYIHAYFMKVSGQLHVPAALSPVKEPPVPKEIEGWVGPRAGLRAVEKIEICYPCREPNPDSLAVQPVT